MTVSETIREVLDRSLDYEEGLDRLTVAPAGDVDRVLTGTLRQLTAALFRGGWQPAELHRLVARQGRPASEWLIVDAVAAYLTGFAPSLVDPRWSGQATELGARVWWADGDDYLTAAASRYRVDRVVLLSDVLELLRTLTSLPSIEILVPPPGSTSALGMPHGIDARLLGRVRALLAKAESTDFPAEAEAFAAKAQELIARHSLHDALTAPGELPLARRLGVDHPYESEKVHVLAAVARANRCEAVWSPELGFTTIFGYDVDIDAVELLYTSLLVQANRAMVRDEPGAGKAGRRRLKTFRKSFLIAYAVRIGERLEAAAAAALTQVAEAADLLPVLASRAALVHESARRVFPETVRARGARVESAEGWELGRAAADRAALGDAR